MNARKKTSVSCLMMFLLGVGILVVSPGCKSHGEYRNKHTRAQAQAREKPQPKSADTAAAPNTHLADGMVWSSLAYPTGDRSTSGVLIEKGIPQEVSVGQPFEYVIRVTNLTSLELHDVVVTDSIPGNFNLSDATPNWRSRDGGVATWVMSNLGPRESREIRVRGDASETGMVTTCATVSYNTQLCAAIKVVQPALKLVKAMTPAVLQCEEIEVKYTVSNNGSGAARNVKITDTLPEGLVTVNDKSAVVTPVGTLGPGESKTYAIKLRATKTGSFSNRAVASADGGLESESSAQTVVTRPVLAITKQGPESLYVGRNITYTITVRNTGDGEARDTVVEDSLASSVEFVSASDGGALNGRNVVWNLGTLAPDAARTLSLTVKPSAKTSVRNVATASAFCADAVTATTDTAVKGIPAILLEVVDVNDPVEVGGQTTYVITATNQGSALGRNVRIVCTLEDAHQFVSASGATRGSSDGKTVTFEALPELAVGGKATWKVVVRAASEADARFKVTMTEDQLKRPVEETEATNFYK